MPSDSDPRAEQVRRWLRRLPADHPLVALLRRLLRARLDAAASETPS